MIDYTPRHAARRPALWRRVLSHPLVSAELAFCIVLVSVIAISASPVGEGIALAIATQQNPTLAAFIVASITILAVGTTIGLLMMLLQRLNRPRRRSTR